MSVKDHRPDTCSGRSTRRGILDRIAAPLTELYGPREARSIALLTASELSGLTASALLTDPSAPLQIEGLDDIIAQLATGRPVQYVLGRAEFCGHLFTVREGVLIPRPETEELVAWIAEAEATTIVESSESPLGSEDLSVTEGEQPIRKNSNRSGPGDKSLKILDVGTGSGCIAASLALALPHAQVFAADISDAALEVAAENFRTLGAQVTLRKADALTDLADVFPDPFDVIVSNPPYVPQSDHGTMHVNVRGYEPREALFVPDDDPLLFYRAIARAGRQMLRPGGRLYFEIYEDFAEAMQRMLGQEGYTATEIRNDINGKPRMLCSRLK